MPRRLSIAVAVAPAMGAAASKIVYDIKDPKAKQTILRNAARYFYGIDKDPS
jgi:hypothetical protein